MTKEQAIDPSLRAECWWRMGRAYFAKDDYTAAIGCFEKALAEPDQSSIERGNVWCDMGRAYMKRGREASPCQP